MHILCTICSDLINQAESIYVTKCGHLFHHHCLAQWIERSKSCPQCRNKVTEKCMFRMYPTISNDITTGEDVATLQSRLDDAQLQLRQQNTICKDREERLLSIQNDLKKNEELIKSYEKKLVSREAAVNGLREQVEYLKVQNKETTKLKEENATLQQNMQLLNGLNNILNATCEDVEKMLQGYTDVRTVAVFANALKRGLCESENKKREIRDKLHAAKQQIAIEKRRASELQVQLINAEGKMNEMECKYQQLSKRKAEEMSDTESDTSVPKQMRSMDLFDTSELADLPVAKDSTRTLVMGVDNAGSPYLSLKQSNIALSASERAPVPKINIGKILPDSTNIGKLKLKSIFDKKESLRMTASDCQKMFPNVCYDGLGGHSKLEIFPVPHNAPARNVIKVSAKHRLKRPTPIGNQDIGKMLEKMKDK